MRPERESKASPNEAKIQPNVQCSAISNHCSKHEHLTTVAAVPVDLSDQVQVVLTDHRCLERSASVQQAIG